MSRQFVRHGRLTVHVRECWVLADNFRRSFGVAADCDEPTLHAFAIEEVRVEYAYRKQGLFTRFINEVTSDPRFELTIVEGVQNPWLRDVLTRWGWDHDPVVMDFYKRK